MPLGETTGLIGEQVVISFISKICLASLKQIYGELFGTKQERALKTAVSISLNKFKVQHPALYEKLFKDQKFRSAFEKEFYRLLDPNQTPNIEELANKVETAPAIPREELLRGIGDLFRNLRSEMMKQNDLRATEQFRVSLGIKENTDAIRAELGIVNNIEELDSKARIASANYLDHFSSSIKIPHTLVDLGFLNSVDKESAEVLTREDIIHRLETKDKIILEAEPGAGKTTTLYQVAKNILDKNEEIFPLFLSLPHWLEDKTFFEYIAQRSAFGEQNLNAKNLQTLARYGHLIFIADGWNELSKEKRKRVEENISNLEIDHPNVGILIATRSISLPPKLNMSLNVSLDKLDRPKRNEIIKGLLDHDRAEKLISKIDNKIALRGITRIPFYLAILIEVFQSTGSLPETKEELLRKFIYAHKGQEVLKEKLYGYHHAYMTHLSIKMLKERTTVLSDDDARRFINEASLVFKNDGRISECPQPKEVLDNLAKYHLLLYRQFDNSWEFQHQQFQEWYASLEVEKIIISASQGDPQSLEELRNELLNIPRWEEPLLFAIERISHKEELREALAKVALNALEIDPMLSAEIICRADDVVWSRIKKPVLDYVERWHEKGKIDRALAFMIASSKPDFAETVWPHISHENRQNRLAALRVFTPFRFNCLGMDWSKKLQGYSEEIRADVLSEISYCGGIEGLVIATEIAVKDQSPLVKKSVINVASFRDSKKHIQKILDGAPPEVWKAYYGRITPDEIEDNETREQVKKNLYQELVAVSKNTNRLRLLLSLWEIGDSSVKEQIFEALANLEDEKDDHWHVFHLIEQVAKIDAQRTASVLIDSLVKGKENRNVYEEFVVHAEKKDRKKLVDFIIEGKGDFRKSTTAAKALRKDEAILLLNKLIELSDEALPLRPRVPEALNDRRNNLERSLKNIPESYLVEAIVEFSKLHVRIWNSAIRFIRRIGNRVYGFINGLEKTSDQPSYPILLKEHHLAELTGLFSWPNSTSGQQPDSHRIELSDKTSSSFRSLLKKWSMRLKESIDDHRCCLAEISMVLGRIGNDEDLPLINELLQYDQDYRAKFLQEWEERGRTGQRPNGLYTNYSNLYRMAFEAMPHRPTVEVVKPYLNNADFCKEAAYILRHAWFLEHGLLSRDKNWSPYPDFSGISESAKKLQNQSRPKPHPYSAAILNRIEELLPQQEDPAVREMIFDLASAVSDTEYGNKIGILERVISLDDRRKYWCIMKLIQRGEKISSSVIKPCCEQALQEWQSQCWEQSNEWYRVEQWLELLALSDNPIEVVDLIRGLPEKIKQQRRIERLLRALEYSPSEEAEKTLTELAIAVPSLQTDGEWLRAIDNQCSEASYQFLYNILSEPDKTRNFKSPGHSGECFAKIIGRILRHHPEIRKNFIEQLSTPLAYEMAEVLGLIIQQLVDDEEIMCASLMLLRNQKRTPYSLTKAIESHVTHKEPLDREGKTYTIVPSSASKLRRKLLEISANDTDRNEDAKRVLAWIDELRDEYGRPEDEPRHPCLTSGIPWPVPLDLKEGGGTLP